MPKTRGKRKVNFQPTKVIKMEKIINASSGELMVPSEPMVPTEPLVPPKPMVTIPFELLIKPESMVPQKPMVPPEPMVLLKPMVPPEPMVSSKPVPMPSTQFVIENDEIDEDLFQNCGNSIEEWCADNDITEALPILKSKFFTVTFISTHLY